jgi:hypothetical protein
MFFVLFLFFSFDFSLDLCFPSLFLQGQVPLLDEISPASLASSHQIETLRNLPTKTEQKLTKKLTEALVHHATPTSAPASAVAREGQTDNPKPKHQQHKKKTPAAPNPLSCKKKKVVRRRREAMRHHVQ